MPALYRSDLGNVDTCIDSALSSEIADSDRLVNSINSFIENASEVLKGATWEYEKQKLMSYISALQQRKAIAETLSAIVKGANSEMTNYLNGYPRTSVDSVDTAQADVLGRAIATCNYVLSQYLTATDLDFEFHPEYYYGKIYEYTEQKQYIEQLPLADQIAQGNYNGLTDEIQNFKSLVNMIK